MTLALPASARAWQTKIRTFVDCELMPHEVEAEMNDGRIDPAVRKRHKQMAIDFGLPGLDGYETCRRLRAEDAGRGATVVALTGWGQDRDRQRSLEAGFDAHMTKPADPKELRRLLER